MVKMKALAGAITLSAFVAACGGAAEEAEPTTDEVVTDETVTEEPVTEEATAEEATTEEETADAAPAAGGEFATKDGVAYASLTGDAAAGKTVFGKCRQCHVVEPGVNRVGPSLAGIVGREAGSVDGFNYSKANAESGITWSEEKLFQYLEDPRGVVVGTKMIFNGLPKAQDRADIIAYLKDPS
ncbi:c-type cytochrome [Parasphingorhabdus sp. DH2-15]|uniref:c-type cytochrome n=1 Tax=Parasphingorhabdus sp. DH2-15 TaxID=3444112 RepID=UPI003F683BC0